MIGMKKILKSYKKDRLRKMPRKYFFRTKTFLKKIIIKQVAVVVKLSETHIK